MRKLLCPILLIAVFVLASCKKEPDFRNPNVDYSELIVGKWFNASYETYHYIEYCADNTYYELLYHHLEGWKDISGVYSLDGNEYTELNSLEGSSVGNTYYIEVTEDYLIYNPHIDIYGSNSPNRFFRIKEQFDIAAKYSYRRALVNFESKSGVSSIELLDGLTYHGNTFIGVEDFDEVTTKEYIKTLFTDFTFSEDGRFNSNSDEVSFLGEYSQNDTSLSMTMRKDDKSITVEALSLLGENSDCLYIMIPQQKDLAKLLLLYMFDAETFAMVSQDELDILAQRVLDSFNDVSIVIALDINS